MSNIEESQIPNILYETAAYVLQTIVFALKKDDLPRLLYGVISKQFGVIEHVDNSLPSALNQCVIMQKQLEEMAKYLQDPVAYIQENSVKPTLN